MRLLLNIIWLIVAGFALFLGYLVAGVVLCILIVTIPWGVASFRIGLYSLWPFGRTVVAKPTAGTFSFLGNVVWVILAGWWLALAHVISGILLCITIIGIPLGIADFKTRARLAGAARQGDRLDPPGRVRRNTDLAALIALAPTARRSSSRPVPDQDART